MHWNRSVKVFLSFSLWFYFKFCGFFTVHKNVWPLTADGRKPTPFHSDGKITGQSLEIGLYLYRIISRSCERQNERCSPFPISKNCFHYVRGKEGKKERAEISDQNQNWLSLALKNQVNFLGRRIRKRKLLEWPNYSKFDFFKPEVNLSIIQLRNLIELLKGNNGVLSVQYNVLCNVRYNFRAIRRQQNILKPFWKHIDESKTPETDFTEKPSNDKKAHPLPFHHFT